AHEGSPRPQGGDGWDSNGSRWPWRPGGVHRPPRPRGPGPTPGHPAGRLWGRSLLLLRERRGDAAHPVRDPAPRLALAGRDRAQAGEGRGGLMGVRYGLVAKWPGYRVGTD